VTVTSKRTKFTCAHMTIDLTEIMRREEQANGYTLLTFGSRPWLNAQDWMDNAVVSVDGRSVRIVLIAARQPSKGTFSRMITGIIKDRLKPVVVNPSVDDGRHFNRLELEQDRRAGRLFRARGMLVPAPEIHRERMTTAVFHKWVEFDTCLSLNGGNARGAAISRSRLARKILGKTLPSFFVDTASGCLSGPPMHSAAPLSAGGEHWRGDLTYSSLMRLWQASPGPDRGVWLSVCAVIIVAIWAKQVITGTISPAFGKGVLRIIEADTEEMAAVFAKSIFKLERTVDYHGWRAVTCRFLLSNASSLNIVHEFRGYSENNGELYSPISRNFDVEWQRGGKWPKVNELRICNRNGIFIKSARINIEMLSRCVT
jgi:hypothetical protein